MPKWLEASLDYLPRWLEFQLDETQQPGCAFAVSYRGEPVYERAFGLADLERKERMTPKHRFRVASHSKSFTAAGVMKLVEAHKLRLDAPVGKYVDGLHPKIAVRTLRQLLSHGGGVHRDGLDSGQWELRRPFLNERELRDDLATAPTLGADVRFKYSNHAFGLAGLAIEAVTGEAYAAWIRREVVRAAGLMHTQPDVPLPKGAPLANGYSMRAPLGRRAIGRNVATHALAAATGFVSTAGDLVKYFDQLDPRATKSFLSVKSRRAMTTARLDIPGLPRGRRYGLGIAHGRVGKTEWFGHSGGFPGYLTRTCVVPSVHVTFSILSNAIDGMAPVWADGIIDVFTTFARRGAPTGSARRWTGRWWNAWGVNDLVPVGDRVLVVRPIQASPFLAATELAVRGDRGRITNADGYGTYGEGVHLVRARGGRATELWLGGGQALPEDAFVRVFRRRSARRG
jgi:CubicO group peptidase (beta-lactamase class C family)